MADKRDYYEVLGVSKEADEAKLKKHTVSLPRNTIQILIPEIKKLRLSSKRHQRLMLY